MNEKTRQFYVVRIEDQKPIAWQQIAETCDPDERVYLVLAGLKRVVVTDMSVREAPQCDECADDGEPRARKVRDIRVTRRDSRVT
jgi:hypothetical protein